MVDKQMNGKKKTCYVAMPFGEREGRNFDILYSSIIKPVIEDCGLECLRSDEFPQRGASEKAI
jgi:hypothetical protein